MKDAAITAADVAAEFRKDEREALETAQQIEKRARLGIEFEGDRGLAAHYRKNAKYYGDRASAIEAAIQTPVENVTLTVDSKEPNPCPKCGAFLWGDTRPCWNCARIASRWF